jgi:tripartite-type tricarboxylate transporter receptor subunit TctC
VNKPTRSSPTPLNGLSRRASACLLALACIAPVAAGAQGYPNKPITLVVGYPPGGGADVLGRLLAQKLTESMGAAVVVENRPGFSAVIAGQYVARAKPDGYTLLIAPWTTYAINSVLFADKMGFVLDRDFVPVSAIGSQPIAMVVSSSLNVSSVAELIALARAKPDLLSFGSTGGGSLEQISGDMFKRAANVKMVHVPYKGSGPAITDLMSGQIQVFFATVPTVMANRQSNRIKALMVTSPERVPALPELPTPGESGLSNYIEARSTYGLLAPAGTPKSVIRRLNDEVAKALSAADVRATLRSLGVEPNWSTPDDLGKYIGADLAKWKRIIKEENIQAD